MTLCGLRMLEKVPKISVFSAGGFGLSSVLNVEISLQPTLTLLIQIKSQNSAFTGLILKLCFTAL